MLKACTAPPSTLTFQKFFLFWEEKASSAARHQSDKLQQPESDTQNFQCFFCFFFITCNLFEIFQQQQNLQWKIQKARATLPVVHGGPPPPAAVDAYGEDAEEEEEAGHAEAHFVDGGVAHQSLAVLPCVQLLTHLAVEGDLSERHSQTTPSSHRTQVGEKNRPCLFRAPEQKDPTLAFLDVTPLKEQKERTGCNNNPSFSPRSPLSSCFFYRLLEGPYNQLSVCPNKRHRWIN